jgi:spectrin beta
LFLLGEALSRIQEKEAILQNRDVGRDTKSVQSLIRKHEAFENDLVALEAQLQVLLDDSAALQDKYPGKNKCHGSMLATWLPLVITTICLNPRFSLE